MEPDINKEDHHLRRTFQFFRKTDSWRSIFKDRKTPSTTVLSYITILKQ